MDEPQFRILLALGPKPMQRLRHVLQIEGDPMRLMGLGRALHQTWPGNQPLDEIKLGRVGQEMQRCGGECFVRDRCLA